MRKRDINLDRAGTGGGGKCESCGERKACVSHVVCRLERIQLCGPCWVPRYLARFADGQYHPGVGHAVAAMPGVNPNSDHDTVMAARRLEMARSARG